MEWVTAIGGQVSGFAAGFIAGLGAALLALRQIAAAYSTTAQAIIALQDGTITDMRKEMAEMKLELIQLRLDVQTLSRKLHRYETSYGPLDEPVAKVELQGVIRPAEA